MSTVRLHAIFLAVGALMALPAAGAAAAPGQRAAQLVELRPLAGDVTTFATAVNDGGLVVGYSAVSGSLSPRRAVRWDNTGTPTDLGTLGGALSTADAVNDNGQITGFAELANGQVHAARWSADGRITDLGTLPGGTTSYGGDIAPDGTVVGTSDASDGLRHAVKWGPRGRITDLGLPAGTEASWAGLVNAAGDVVGGAATHLGVITSLRWNRDNVMVPLPGLDGSGAYAYDLAADGTAVGEADTSAAGYPVRWDRAGHLTQLSAQRGAAGAIGADGTIVGHVEDHAVKWDRQGRPITLGALPDGAQSWARDVNGRGVVVGNVMRSDIAAGRAVYWDRNGRIVELPTPDGAQDGGAEKINRSGLVIGGFSLVSGGHHAVLWK
ncbi:hypothetical protein [Amycolatopsis nalaikhensis]|uniref:Extracellular repeat protein, HAF family n=1 Tax=Amycolatopsis nalaikhensis TaxID=715472 RepID=A0ABY8XE45_9PSEU|nr:hypothetical protein [Amycolatopsis sp. 2-2]WIV53884.1 hypothetical protein QP939_34100 [Amycolatopsis sp. 2-2]